jgi:hypothetical protein
VESVKSTQEQLIKMRKAQVEHVRLIFGHRLAGFEDGALVAIVGTQVCTPHGAVKKVEQYLKSTHIKVN